jgi:steroid 5-alpha reductase family enzyme
MGFWEIYLGAGGMILGLMLALWLLSLMLRNSSIVDIFWGTGFVIAASIYFMLTFDGDPAQKLLLMILVVLWGGRLSIHVLLRNWGKPEDFRYQKWREENDANWWWISLFKVFLLQGILLWIISIPLLAAQYALPNAPAVLIVIIDGLGVLLWGVGFFFETVGDWQLARFKSNPANKGKLMTSGVWRYTRHPNYFGDAAQWWGFGLLALAAGGWWTLYAPALMTYLLIKVSGVAMLEKSMVKRPGYDKYARATSVFIPWFPRYSKRK